MVYVFYLKPATCNVQATIGGGIFPFKTYLPAASQGRMRIFVID
jgi:hypothetical protein